MTSVASFKDDPEAWKQSAACKGADTNRFHSESRSEIEWCKSICADCTVRQDCLEWALPYDRANSFCATMGVYGGMTPDERRLYWKRLQRATQPLRRTVIA